MIINTYNVVGMTCDHCARSVAREVALVDGVDDVTVDLATGVVTVTSNADLDVAAIGDAVDEAGYELVG
jgi:copper chaperone CopZ